MHFPRFVTFSAVSRSLRSASPAARLVQCTSAKGVTSTESETTTKKLPHDGDKSTELYFSAVVMSLSVAWEAQHGSDDSGPKCLLNSLLGAPL